MDYFDFKDNRLYCEDVDVNTIAAKVGTPVFIYSTRTLLEHFRKLDRALTPIDHLICYSVKANSNVAILKLLANEGAGFDIVSGGELYRARVAGADTSKVVFAGVSKTVDEIREAIEHDILFFSVESEQELERINNIAGGLGKVARFAIRVNPDVDPMTHKNITTGKLENKFGLDMELTLKVYDASRQMKNVEAAGIQMHIGSQLVSDEPYMTTIKKIKPLIAKIRALGIDLKYLDIGGGLGVIYNEESPTTADEFARHVIPLIEDLAMTLVIEPGRFIAANAGALLTEVQYIKENPLKRFVMVDAGMNDLIRPALYQSFHKITPTVAGVTETFTANIVGPICESSDVFGYDREIPVVGQGDILAIMSAGAYGSSMSSNYNSKLKAPEVLVNGGQYHIIRQREENADMVRNEQLPDYLV
jgi:diaminopimelate decarboxylase